MICYHGTPITPEKALTRALRFRHGFVSFFCPRQIELVAEVCASFALDNGAFSAWRRGDPVSDWAPYVDWCRKWGRHPGCSWVVIPDVIDGSEEDNDRLIDWWIAQRVPVEAVPVWHLHESLDRLIALARAWPRVAVGSSGMFAKIGTVDWWHRMGEVMMAICDEERFPIVKLHGLRMLSPTILSHLPFASADSTMVARNIGIDQKWRGPFAPKSRVGRACVLVDNIDHHPKAHRWSGVHGHQMNFELMG